MVPSTLGTGWAQHERQVPAKATPEESCERLGDVGRVSKGTGKTRS